MGWRDEREEFVQTCTVLLHAAVLQLQRGYTHQSETYCLFGQKSTVSWYQRQYRTVHSCPGHSITGTGAHWICY